MDQPHSDPPERTGSGFSLLRPAVPPRPGAPAERGRAEGALRPFSGGRRPAPEPEQPPADSSAGAPASDEDLPWAVLDAPLWDEPTSGLPAAPAPEIGAEDDPLLYEVEELSSGGEAEWLEFEASGEAPMADVALEPLADAVDPAQEPLLGEELLAPPEWEYGYDEAIPDGLHPLQDAPAPAPAGSLDPDEAAPAPPPAVGSAALEDVASRLEGIARSLRGGNPADLLSGTSDPLQLLIAGYALGLEAARASRQPTPEED